MANVRLSQPFWGDWLYTHTLFCTKWIDGFAKGVQLEFLFRRFSAPYTSYTMIQAQVDEGKLSEYDTIVHSHKDGLPGISGIRCILAIAPIRPRVALPPVLCLMTMDLRYPLNWETIHSVKRWHRKTDKLFQSHVTLVYEKSCVNCITSVHSRHIMVIAVPPAGILTCRHEPLPLLELFSAWISAPFHQPNLGIACQFVCNDIFWWKGIARITYLFENQLRVTNHVTRRWLKLLGRKANPAPFTVMA